MTPEAPSRRMRAESERSERRSPDDLRGLRGASERRAARPRSAQGPKAPRAPAGRVEANPEGVSGAARPKAEPLGKNTENPSGDGSRVDRRRGRFALREVLRAVTTVRRCSGCGNWRVPGVGEPTVAVKATETGNVAHFQGVQLCGRIWICPVCGPRIRAVRSEDLNSACAEWIRHHGDGSVLLLTLTLPHDFGEKLTTLLDITRAGFATIVSGRAWQRVKRDFGLVHYVRAHDFTVGPNGWHPHLHVALFASHALTESNLAALETRMHSQWARAVSKHGHREPDRRHGVKLEQARSRADIARYVSQVIVGSGDHSANLANELARSDLKQSHHLGHRTPWQVLASLAESGDTADLAIWHEWEAATRGVHAIRWSNGLRRAVGLGKQATDEEIAASEVGGNVVYRFDSGEWNVVRKIRGAPARILELAENRGSEAVRAFVQRAVAPRPSG